VLTRLQKIRYEPEFTQFALIAGWLAI
jgi:hypothetical protein